MPIATSADKTRVVLVPPGSMTVLASFEIANVRHVVRVRGCGWGVMDRCIIIFHRPVTLPGVSGATSALVLYFTYNSFGLTAEERKMVQGKRVLEIEEGVGEKRQKTLGGRAAKVRAREDIRRKLTAPTDVDEVHMLQQGHAARIMTKTVAKFSEVFARYWAGVDPPEAPPHAPLPVSTVTTTPEAEQCVELYVPSTGGTRDNPLRLAMTDEGTALVLLQRHLPQRTYQVFFPEQIEFALCVTFPEDDEGGEDTAAEVDLGEVDQVEGMLVMYRRRKLPPGAAGSSETQVQACKFRVCVAAHLARVQRFFVDAGVKFVPVMATEAEVRALNGLHLCEAREALLEYADGTREIESGPLTGLVYHDVAVHSDGAGVEHESDSDEFDPDAESEEGGGWETSVSYESEDDELEVMERRLRMEARLAQLTTLPGGGAVVDEFKALAGAEQTKARLGALVAAAGLAMPSVSGSDEGSESSSDE